VRPHATSFCSQHTSIIYFVCAWLGVKLALAWCSLLALHSRHVKKTHGFFLTGRLATTFDFLYQFTAIRIYGRGENIPSTFEAYLEFNCFLSIKADEVELVQSQYIYTFKEGEEKYARAQHKELADAANCKLATDVDCILSLVPVWFTSCHSLRDQVLYYK
jgi:hypothetical protein